MMNACLQFVPQLEKVNGLTWLPWVGEQYPTEHQRLLVLGESHYCYGNHSPQELEHFPKETMEVVKDYAEKGRDAGNQYKTYETMDNVLRQVFYPQASRQEIWSKIAYMNIVQKCMDNNQSRPHWEDFLNGWQEVLQVINIIRPNLCLCFSLDKMHNRVNFNRLEEFKHQMSFKFSIRPTQDTQMRISRCIVATPGGIVIDDTREIPVIFVQHASRIRDIQGWSNVIKQYCPF